MIVPSHGLDYMLLRVRQAQADEPIHHCMVYVLLQNADDIAELQNHLCAAGHALPWRFVFCLLRLSESRNP